MEKNLEYYMTLPYTILIKKTENQGGSLSYIARILELPHVLGDGETSQEALDCLNTHMAMAIQSCLKDGLPVPEPQSKYSGNLNVRVDPELHARLAQEASALDMSLNKYTSLILERRHVYTAGNSSSQENRPESPNRRHSAKV